MVVFFGLWGMFFSSIFLRRYSVIFDIICLAVFVVFAGQRFETGNDWFVYRNHYSDMQQIGLLGLSYGGILVFEPFYVFTAWFFGLFLDFQNFLLVVALFNGLVLYRFSRFLRGSFPGVVAIYYSWLYLATQMATIRYSLAISFLMLALIAYLDAKRWRAYLLAVVGCGFHLFSLVFLPLFFLIGKKFDFYRVLLLSVVVGFFWYVLFRALGDGWGEGLPFLEKVSFYLREGVVGRVSFGIVVYLLINVFFLIWVVFAFGDGPWTRLVKWCVFYLVFFQIFLWMLPVFWNRVQVLALTVQACVVSQYISSGRRVVLFCLASLMSLFVIFRSLSAPAFVSYVPYQSYWADYLLSDDFRGDGEERYFEALEEQQLMHGK